MFPRTQDRASPEAVVINTAGGIAGGDRLECAVTALENASIAVTSQTPERVYRALQQPAQVTTRLEARDGARLAWLPQETIVFDRARLRRRTEVELSGHAEILALEWFVLGRAARGEEVIDGSISESWQVRVDGRLVWADAFRATGETLLQLRRSALLSRNRAAATLIHAGPHLQEGLEPIRDLIASLECAGGATSVGGLVIVRLVAVVASELRRAVRAFLEEFGRVRSSGPFRVPKMWSS